MRPAGWRWHVAAAFVILAAGCHLALGLESAEEIDSTSGPDPECTANAGCDDDNPCTDDACVDSICTHVDVEGDVPSALQTAGDCQRMVCRGGRVEPTVDDDDPPVDGVACTDDVCSLGEGFNPPLAGGSPCPTGVCSGDGACVECFSNDQCVTPDTCGGGGALFTCGCAPTTCEALGLTCGNAPNGCVGALNCNSSSMDGDETDVDCGGSTATCPRRCAAGLACDGPSDCASNVCTSGACVGN